MRHLKISSNNSLCVLMRDFHEVFGIKLMDYFDEDLLHIGFLVFDIIKFDDWLHGKFGNYESKKKSMMDIVGENYGEKGNLLINDLIEKQFIAK